MDYEAWTRKPHSVAQKVYEVGRPRRKSFTECMRFGAEANFNNPARDTSQRKSRLFGEVAQPNFGRFSQISALQLKAVGLENWATAWNIGQ